MPEELGPSRPRASWRPLVLVLAGILAVAAAAITFQLRRADSGDQATKSSCAEFDVRGELELATAEPAAAADLTRAAAVLQRRLTGLDCHDPRVIVAGDRLQVSASADVLSALDALLAPGDLQLREVQLRRPGTSCATTGQAPRTLRAGERVSACTTDGTEQLDLLPAAVTGTDVDKATASQDALQHSWQVILTFTKAGQRRFTDLTSRLIGKQLALVVDGVVVSAPHIQERISGDAQITGSFTEEQAKALATELSSGPLPVQLHRV